MTISCDFDGVVHAYSRGWDDGTIYDPPLPGALDGLRRLLQYDAVFIHTTRKPEQVMPWLEEHGFDVTIDERCRSCLDIAHLGLCPDCHDSGLITFWNQLGQLLVTNRKLPAVAYIDDRAVRFENWEQTLAALGMPVPDVPGQGDRTAEDDSPATGGIVRTAPLVGEVVDCGPLPTRPDAVRTRPDTGPSDTDTGVRVEYRATVPRHMVGHALAEALGAIARETGAADAPPSTEEGDRRGDN